MPNSSDESSDYVYMLNMDSEIVGARAIFCLISLIPCLFLIVVYVILVLQVKFNILTRKSATDSQEASAESLIEQIKTQEDNLPQNEKGKNKKIGLGSNFMFFIVFSNFIGALIETTFYKYYKLRTENVEMDDLEQVKEAFANINDEGLCKFYGFSHNFFDLFAVCWTTMLTLLFYKSTNLTSEMLYKDKKYMIIGFLYSVLTCGIFCGIPLATGSYGFGRFYCTFEYVNDVDIGKASETHVAKFFRYAFVLIATSNGLINCYWLILTSKYYSKKLKMLKGQNKNEYSLMLKFVWVFRIFPIVLILSRLVKGISRMIIDSTDNSSLVLVIGYINGFFFASNGLFNSLASIIFFRGVFWCCVKVTRKQSDDTAVLGGDYNDMNDIKGEEGVCRDTDAKKEETGEGVTV